MIPSPPSFRYSLGLPDNAQAARSPLRLRLPYVSGLNTVLFCSFALAVQVPISTSAQSSASSPAKIEVMTESSAVTAGSNAQVRVNLLDSNNQPAITKKDLTVQVQSQSPSSDTETFAVIVKAGEKSGTVEIPAKKPGLLKLLASNRQLASGGSILNVGKKQQEMASPSPTPLASAPLASASPEASITAPFSPALSPKLRIQSFPRKPVAAARTGAAMPSISAPLPMTAAPPVSAVSAWNPPLTFMYVPERKIWADSKDAATVYANLPPDEIAPWDMLIYVMSSVGSLDPEPLIIPKGQNSGKARLTYDRPAEVFVKFMSSNPWAKAVAGLPLKIAFGPTKLRIVPNPPSIGLFESTELDVELADAHGNPVSDDEEHVVALTVATGSGGLDDSGLKIDPKGFRAVTKFRPILPGTVKFLAESPNLGSGETELAVVTPTLILILCAVGGLMGGLVAYVTDKDAKWPRFFIGVVTGFVLYWLIVFGLVVIPSFPHILVFNPFSAAILGVFGGWLGTKVFTLGLQKIGINV
jgi:hypothetical protein